MEEIITRKDHECTFCERVIPKGSTCMFSKGRCGRHDDDDKQIGIEYWSAYLCPEGDRGCVEPLKTNNSKAL